MNAVRLLAVVSVVVSVGLLTPQTGAFTSATADRSVSVSVVDDEDAYLGIQRSPVSLAGNREVVLLTVTNRFQRALDLTVRVTERNPGVAPTVTAVDGPAALAPGGAAPVTASVTCVDSTASGRPTVTLNASGEGVSVMATRSVAVDCVDSAAQPPAQANGRNHTAATSTARKRYEPRINSIVASFGSAR